MIELIRIVENQSTLYSYRATQNEERARQLELLLEMTTIKNTKKSWHPLIATSFKYPPPHTSARFRPPYGKNVFYGSFIAETALYEQAFHFMKERVHLKIKTDTGVRTIFFVDANNSCAKEIKNHPDYAQIMHKNDYRASHQFIANNPITFIIYPSCRDPKKRDNAAVLDINHLAKKPKWESSIKFFYDNQSKQISWLDYDLHIQWNEVN